MDHLLRFTCTVEDVGIAAWCDDCDDWVVVLGFDVTADQVVEAQATHRRNAGKEEK